MSHFHYIASKYELKTGNYGYEKVTIENIRKNSPNTVIINNEIEYQLGILQDENLEWLKENLIVFDTEYGGAGITVSERIVEKIGIKQHFTNDHIYAIFPNWGHLMFYENQDEISMKCVEIFIEYLKNEIKAGYTLEFLTTWAGEETRKLNTVLEIDLSDEDQIRKMKIQDRQLIRFTV